MGLSQRVLAVVGARPNFMKMAPIVRQLRRSPEVFETRLVHTGQHYDAEMSDLFFEQLGIPHPDVNLQIGSASHAQQTAAIMAKFEPVLLDWRPDLVLVVGDVNSTLACALVASKLGIEVAHVEAGLRSFDRSMPEEINRVLTDQISTLLFTTEPSAEVNLCREGIRREQIHFVGNVMIDTLLVNRHRACQLGVPKRFGLNGGYGLMTLHRPTNVDSLPAFERLMCAVGAIAGDVPVVFPVHPRTRQVLAQSKIAEQLMRQGRLRVLDPLGYLEFLGLMSESCIVLTDSGGIQEETTILGVPCLTLRENTERPVTVTHGTNQVVGTDPERIIAAWRGVRAAPRGSKRTPPFWDGNAAARIVKLLSKRASRPGAEFHWNGHPQARR